MTKYFTNNFDIINLYKKPSIKSEIVTQMIFGNNFSKHTSGRKWLKIKIKEDGYKGYIKNRKFSKYYRPTHKVNILKAKWPSPESRKRLASSCRNLAIGSSKAT